MPPKAYEPKIRDGFISALQSQLQIKPLGD